MNKEYLNLVSLLGKIDQTKKELKRLRSEYKEVFAAICKSWKKDIEMKYPNLKPCNVSEYVGVDVVYKGITYNVYISEYRNKLYCMFSYDRKDKTTYSLALKDAGRELEDKLNELFFNDTDNKSSVCYTGHGIYKVFKKENYDEVFEFFQKVVKAFTY